VAERRVLWETFESRKDKNKNLGYGTGRSSVIYADQLLFLG
jgi:hypothetical protein